MIENQVAILMQKARNKCVAVSLMDELSQQDLSFCYQVQKNIIELNQQTGNKLSGWKVAFSSQPALDRFALQEPVYAPLFQSNVLSGELTQDQTIAPKIESEVLFILGKDLSSNQVSDDEILSAIEWMAPAIEVADCRIQGWKFDVSHFVSDNAAAGFYQIGSVIPFDSNAFDESTFTCHLETREGVEVGKLSNVLSGPVGSLLRMIKGILGVFGELKAGQHFLSGSLTKPVNMAPGHTYCLKLLGQTVELHYK